MDMFSKKIADQAQHARALREHVLQVINQSEKPLTHNEIINLTGIKYRVLRGILAQLKKEQLIFFHPPRSYFHKMVEVPLGKQFTIRPRQTVTFPDEGILLKWVKVSQKWVQNEEMGYSYDAEFEIEYQGNKKKFVVDWYDRTSGELEIYNRVLPGFDILVHDTDAHIIWMEIKRSAAS